MNHDLERVAADLIVMKNACATQAVPHEEIGVSLVAAGALAALAVADALLPTFWLKAGVVTVAAVGTAIYAPWKWRILRADRLRRRFEAREIAAWMVALAGLLVWFLCRRLFWSGDESIRLQDSGTLFFWIGLGFVISSVVRPARWHSLAARAILMTAGALVALAATPRTVIPIYATAGALAALVNAAGLAHLERRERQTHGSH